jgi:hypothetical protein
MHFSPSIYNILFRNGHTSEITGNRCYFCFFKWKGPTLILSLDSTLNFEFRTSFCQHFSVTVFEPSSFSQKAVLQGFIKKCITPEPLEINKRFFFN